MHRALCYAVVLTACCGLFGGPVSAQGAGNALEFRKTPYFLVVLVHATGLDYQNQPRLVRSLYKSQMKGGFLGHPWVVLSGVEEGRRRVVEAGLTPKDAESVQFFRGVLDLAEYGYVNPTAEQKRNPRYEPDPISYLWRDLGNGYLRMESQGGLQPTFAAKVDLNPDQYLRIKARLDSKLSSHKQFQVTGQQCSSVVAELAALAGGVSLGHGFVIASVDGVQQPVLTPTVAVRHEPYHLVGCGRAQAMDECYRRITLAKGQRKGADAFFPVFLYLEDEDIRRNCGENALIDDRDEPNRIARLRGAEMARIAGGQALPARRCLPAEISNMDGKNGG